MENTYRLLAFIGCILLIGCHSVNEKMGLGDDNAFEETAEEVVESLIQYKTGYRPELDFTPGSSEK